MLYPLGRYIVCRMDWHSNCCRGRASRRVAPVLHAAFGVCDGLVPKDKMLAPRLAALFYKCETTSEREVPRHLIHKLAAVLAPHSRLGLHPARTGLPLPTRPTAARLAAILFMRVSVWCSES